MKFLTILLMLVTALVACDEAVPVLEVQNNNEEVLYLDNNPLAEELRENPAVMLQLTPVPAGEELVVLHTSMGDITLRLFPGEAPRAVENFLTHARSGYYDGVVFHRVIPNFMIQTGDPTGTGSGGQSIWGESFTVETSNHLRHFRGALAMAHAGGAMGSQFYIVQNPILHPGYVQDFTDLINSQNDVLGHFQDGSNLTVSHIHPADGLRYFLENGGTPHLDWFWNQQNLPHTVFGHVVSGMEVVDAIAAVTTAPGDRPLEDITIDRISFIIAEQDDDVS